MTTETLSTPSTDEGPADFAAGTKRSDAASKQHAKLEAAALKNLLAPVAPMLTTGVVIQIFASIASFAPYIGVALLGTALLSNPVEESGAWRAVFVILGGAGLRAILGFGALMITHVADVKLMSHLREKMVATIARAPLAWFTARSSGQIRKALDNDLKDMHYLVAHARVEMAGAAVTPVVGLIITFTLDWRLGLLSIATVPLFLGAFMVMSMGQTQGMHMMDAKLARVSSTLAELVDGISVIKVFGTTGQAHRQYRESAEGFSTFFHTWVGKTMRLSAIASLFMTAPIILLVVVGGGWFLVDSGAVQPMDVVLTALIAMVIPGALMTVANAQYAAQQAAQAAYRVNAVLETKPLPPSLTSAQPGGSTIVFDKVSYAYVPGEPVVRGVSFTARQGEVTALVGRSGSGKSTVASLVPRFADPDEGSVSIGGVDVRDIPESVLYSTVGFVLQSVQLLNLSVLENIRLGLPGADRDAVERAARAAQIHEVIEALPRGYDSVIGEDAQLSGGERQRVSIARALIADPPVVVLDEATAFADPDSEAAIQEALSTLLAGRTVIVIAHRLDVVKGAHNIVVLERGELAEQGTHAELLDHNGHYAALWNAYGGKHSDAAASDAERK